MFLWILVSLFTILIITLWLSLYRGVALPFSRHHLGFGEVKSLFIFGVTQVCIEYHTVKSFKWRRDSESCKNFYEPVFYSWLSIGESISDIPRSPFPAYPLEKSAMFFQEYIRLFSIPRQIIPYNVHTDILYCIGMYIIGYSRQIHEDRPLIGVHPIWTT